MNWRRMLCGLFRRHVWTAIDLAEPVFEYDEFTIRLADGRWSRRIYERCRFCGRFRYRFLLTRNGERVRCEELASDRRPHLRGAQPQHPSIVQKNNEAQAETGVYHNGYDAQQCPT